MRKPHQNNQHLSLKVAGAQEECHLSCSGQAEVEGSVQGQPQLHSALEASLSYMRLCLTNNKKIQG